MKDVEVLRAEKFERYNFKDDKIEPNGESISAWINSSKIWIPVEKIKHNIDRGLYKIIYSNTFDSWGLEKTNLSFTEELYIFEDNIQDKMVNEMKEFWNSKDKYYKYNMSHKRGILLHGDPGCGKSSIVNLFLRYIINTGQGIAIIVDRGRDEIFQIINMIKNIKRTQPNVPIIIVVEDIDAIFQSSLDIQSAMLNILDGVEGVEGVFFIATTNHPEVLEERITNRPSRFDRRYYIGTPTREMREFYITKKISNDDLKKIDIDEWVNKTDGYTISHIKELIISVFVFDYSFEEAIEILNDMNNNPEIKISSNKKGKGIGFN